MTFQWDVVVSPWAKVQDTTIERRKSKNLQGGPNLLLNVAFKPATPLTNGVIHDMLWQFVPLGDISQGSVAIQVTTGVWLSF